MRRDSLVSARERMVAWMLWSPRRLVAVGAIAVTLVVGSVLLGVIAGSRGGAAPEDGTATDGSLRSAEVACRAAVTRWAGVFADPTVDDADWVARVRRETTDRADTWVPMTDRGLIPRGPVRITGTEVAPESCEATVAFADGALWVVGAVPQTPGRWAVDTWDDGS